MTMYAATPKKCRSLLPSLHQRYPFAGKTTRSFGPANDTDRHRRDRRSNILRPAALLYMRDYLPHTARYDSLSVDRKRQRRSAGGVHTFLAAASRKERVRVLNRRARLATATLAAALVAVGGQAPASAAQSMT